MTGRWLLVAAVAVQVVCAIVFLWQLIISIFGLTATPIAWQIHELIEIGAVLGLVLGGVLGIVALRQAIRRTERAEDALRVASGAFTELMEERFADWRLTAAERDVALFAIKGLSTAEIAEMRSVSEGTVKAQTAAIYRKAGVSGRAQLLSLFIDDLMQDGVNGRDQSSSAVA